MYIGSLVYVYYKCGNVFWEGGLYVGSVVYVYWECGLCILGVWSMCIRSVAMSFGRMVYLY